MRELKPCSASKNRYCYRWNCRRPECRKKKIQAEITHMLLGIESMKANSEYIWFLTSYLESAPNRPLTYEETLDFRDRINTLYATIRYHAKKHDISLMYAKLYALKTKYAKSPYELHVHSVLTWLPNPYPDPTPNSEHRHTSEVLSKRAHDLGLSIWINKVYDIKSLIAGYFQQNLWTLENFELPHRFRPTSFSRNYPQMEYQKARARRRRKNR